jgi:retron-type reverse transcriptase
MQTYTNLYSKIYALENLKLAYRKAKKGKSKRDYVIEFEMDLQNNLFKLREELRNLTYRPKQLKTFIIRDPKLRKISKSEFKDRIVHHALINIIEPIFEKIFIHDSYANRKNKGASNALFRLKCFIRKISKNNNKKVYCLKYDIRHYFENINHEILIHTIKEKINDNNIINLFYLILKNHYSNIGLPLGNLTSQFLANVYLNDLDYFIKHELKIKYYLRYVDDFIILHNDKKILEFYKEKISAFLKHNLKIELHDEKSKITQLKQGINFLGFRNFYYYSILKKNKRRLINNKFNLVIQSYKETNNYKRLMQRIEAILAHIESCNSFNLRKHLVNKLCNT